MPERHASQGQPRPAVTTSSSTGGFIPRNTRSGTNSVRRNLFQSQLTRRPTPGSSASASTETLHLDPSESQSQPEEAGEIVVRDQNGDVELGDPPTPPMDDLDDGETENGKETEKQRQQLAELVKHHQINQNSVPSQPEELLEAVRASLRAKVADLLEDNWMYEPEEMTRPH